MIPGATVFPQGMFTAAREPLFPTCSSSLSFVVGDGLADVLVTRHLACQYHHLSVAPWLERIPPLFIHGLLFIQLSRRTVFEAGMEKQVSNRSVKTLSAVLVRSPSCHVVVVPSMDPETTGSLPRPATLSRTSPCLLVCSSTSLRTSLIRRML